MLHQAQCLAAKEQLQSVLQSVRGTLLTSTCDVLRENHNSLHPHNAKSRNLQVTCRPPQLQARVCPHWGSDDPVYAVWWPAGCGLQGCRGCAWHPVSTCQATCQSPAAAVPAWQRQINCSHCLTLTAKLASLISPMQNAGTTCPSFNSTFLSQSTCQDAQYDAHAGLEPP